ncbi:type I restriction modification DNA specificity domain protein [Bacteroides fragilis str. S38L5]|uniref:restriction endonuclease subunit S n=1 Tax=Bacteroides fragilis TaxID=817 RepID=UPI00044AA13B|nr:restriction endonuclease subunit S [Bacteroides fragilis]EYA96867.1 type I restriction modification DNA specificity domain protein [Bacteroides fragilis str. S38L5]
MGNVPNLRFPEFSGEWKKCTIDDLCEEFKSGKNIKADNILNEGEYPVFGGNGLRGYTDCYNHEGDYVLIGRQGALCGNIRFVTGKTYITEHAIAAKATNNNNTRFLESLFIQLNLGKFSDQSAQPGLAVNKLLKIETSVPSKDEQEKIASLLQNIDKRIATQNKIIDKLQSLIKGLNDDIHKNMKGELVCFADLGEAYAGLSGKSGDDFGCGEPFITYMNVYQNTYISEKDYELVQIAPNEKQNCVQYGDALFTLSSETPEEVGMGAVYLGSAQKLYLNSFCFGVHFHDDRVLPQYLTHFISSTSFRKTIYPLAQGSTRFNLQKNDFMKMEFVLPTLKEQKRIAQSLDALHCRLANEKLLAERYLLLKQHLLSQMFI